MQVCMVLLFDDCYVLLFLSCYNRDEDCWTTVSYVTNCTAVGRGRTLNVDGQRLLTIYRKRDERVVTHWLKITYVVQCAEWLKTYVPLGALQKQSLGETLVVQARAGQPVRKVTAGACFKLIIQDWTHYCNSNHDATRRVG